MEAEEIVHTIVDRLAAGRSVLLTAPTGWGKTRLAFAVASELSRRGFKIAILFPTLTLAVRKWRELTAFAPRSAILTSGAHQYCVYRWNYPQRFCHRCELRKSAEGVNLPQYVTFQDVELVVPEDVCGYWVQEAVMPRYDVVVAHYNRAHRLHAHYLIIDEAHEYFLPAISTYRLADIADAVGTSLDADIAALREAVEARLHTADPKTEDVLYPLWQDLRSKTCWLEDDAVHCLDLRAMPTGRPVLAVTATPPPGWPPEGWDKIEIKPAARPKALVAADASFYYSNNYRGASLLLWMVFRQLAQRGAARIAVFATSSLRRVLETNLPPGAELYPPGARRRLGQDEGGGGFARVRRRGHLLAVSAHNSQEEATRGEERPRSYGADTGGPAGGPDPPPPPRRDIQRRATAAGRGLCRCPLLAAPPLHRPVLRRRRTPVGRTPSFSSADLDGYPHAV